MKITIRIDKAEAIRAGFNQHGTLEADIDPADLTEPQRNALATHEAGYKPQLDVAPPGDLNAIRAALDPMAAAEAERQADLARRTAIYNRARADWEDLDPADQIEFTKYGPRAVPAPEIPGVYGDTNDPSTDTENRRRSKISEQVDQGFQSLYDLDKARARQLAEIRRQADEAALNAATAADLAAQYGAGRIYLTAEQITRLDAGVLPREEMIDMIRAALLPAPLDAAPSITEYEKITRDDLDHDYSEYEDCPGRLNVTVTDQTTATATQWARRNRLIAALPIAPTSITIRQHAASCSNCAADLVRTGIKCTVEWTPGHFVTREYAAE